MLNSVEKLEYRRLVQPELQQYVSWLTTNGGSYGPRIVGDCLGQSNQPMARLFEVESPEQPQEMPQLQRLVDALADGPSSEELRRFLGDIYADLFIASFTVTHSPLRQVRGRRLSTFGLHVADVAEMSTYTLAYVLGSAAGLAQALTTKAGSEVVLYAKAPRLYISESRWSLTFCGAVQYLLEPVTPAEVADGRQ